MEIGPENYKNELRSNGWRDMAGKVEFKHVR